MAQVTYSFRIDENLKRQADLFCSDVGMNLSTAIMICLKRIIRENRFPFEISADPHYNEETIAAIEEANRLSRDPNAKRYSSWAELKAELDAEMEAEGDV